jgi:tRNA1(Val) A37 N6-methylase TrmN6
MYNMRKYKIEPKLMRLIHPSPGKKPNLVLICGTRDGRAELRIQEPLYVYDGTGRYTKEIDEIYNRVSSDRDSIIAGTPDAGSG